MMYPLPPQAGYPTIYAPQGLISPPPVQKQAYPPSLSNPFVGPTAYGSPYMPTPAPSNFNWPPAYPVIPSYRPVTPPATNPYNPYPTTALPVAVQVPPKAPSPAPESQPAKAPERKPSPAAPSVPEEDQWLQMLMKLLSSPDGVNPFAPVSAPQGPQPTPWNNQLKSMLQNNESVIYAMNLRTFGAADKDGDGKISLEKGENGTFLSAIPYLDELKSMGVNTLHLLPINPLGQYVRFGEAGSLYAPSDYHSVNPEFDTPGNNTNVLEEARMFVNECHKRGIHVMVDIPSCASYDLAGNRPDLIAMDENGNTKTPTNWVDIIMMKKDTPEVRKYFEGFCDLMIDQVGVDGFRVDVARARGPEFWQHFTQKYPNVGWLAETYVKEDASPLKNIPADDPEGLLKAGMDAFYGQLHIFHLWPSADEYMNYMLEARAMMKRASQASNGANRSILGSFLTHDDPSMMHNGGPLMYFLASGLMATQPWTNPYILDGYMTGYAGHFDIFNWTTRPIGNHPEIGRFTSYLFNKRQGPWKEIVSKGLFIPIKPVATDSKNNQILSFARYYKGKTLLVVANKDVNARHIGSLQIPGLPADQKLVNLAPEYGQPSTLKVNGKIPGQLDVDLGPGRFHIFEINTPTLPMSTRYYS